MLSALGLGSRVSYHEMGKEDKKYNPEKTVSFLSRITYWWYNRVITLGYHKPLVREDLFELNNDDSSYVVCSHFENKWRQQVQMSQRISKVSGDKEARFGKTYKPSLVNALWQNFRSMLIQIALLKVLADVVAFVSPLILKQLIAFCEDRTSFGWNGYSLAGGLFLAAVLQTLMLQYYQRYNMLTAAKIKTAAVCLLYRKSLNLANSARQRYTTGEIVNLMSTDAQQLMDLSLNLNLLWSAPFQILMAIIFLWQELGVSVLAGFAVLLLIIPLNAFVASRMKALRKTHLKAKDQRVKLLNEILQGIKILKLYAWEPSFQSKVLEIREKEIDVLKSSGYLSAFSMLTLTCVPFLVSLATFGMYVMLDDANVLTASKVFTSISLFNILRLPLFDLPTVISTVVQTRVSVTRLEAFLCEGELNPDSVETEYRGGHAVGFTNASFCWDNVEPPILKHITLKIPEGSLIAVVGQVGAGKSSFLSAILGEMEKLEGSVQRKGSVAYVSQQAWIQNATLQENILFGSELHNTRYQQTLNSCALLPDLDLLMDGDQTEIGERGVNLSGGQKQRVSLARAVYSNADIYLLDDPLSAVDVHVGKHLFEKLIGPLGLLKNKTRILVTHSLTVLPYADKIVVMEDGRITEVGTYQELLSNRQNFAEFLETFSKEKGNHSRAALERSASLKSSLIKSSSQWKEQLSAKASFAHEPKGPNTTKKEKIATGSVKMSIITRYLLAFGRLGVFFTVVAYIGQNVTAISQNLWLSSWTAEAKKVTDVMDWVHIRNSRLSVYGLLGLVQGLLVFFGAYILTKGAVNASRTLHHEMLNSVLHLPLLFFETTPLGQVINRFTKDVYVIDERFHYYLRTWINCMFDVIGTVLVICAATPLFLMVIVPLGVLYLTVQRYYIASSRQIRRLDGASRSPVISHFSETLFGVPTIRAYGHQERFTCQNKDTVNENLVCYYNNVISNRWLAIRLEFLGNLMIFFAALFAVLGREHLSSGTVGLSISYALNITQTLNFWVRKACEIETNAVAIERVCEYSGMKKEAPWILPKRPPREWPDKGVIQFVNYQARYREDLGLALQDITFQTNSKEKVGIVGRTGAGKSTLTNGLFRIIEGAGGKILIDGIDIATLGLHDLRSKLNIIPQDPVLFSGTLRQNLDPLEKYSDMQLWEAVELCHLKDFVQALHKKLHHEISEGGGNLSVGQRQLVCLARALLRKTKILVLDEATASIDMETDSVVQSTIRKEFADCTVLTIAHRIHTIMDSQRVLVLDSGRIVEFGPVDAMIHQKGAFYKMVSESGLIQNAASVSTDEVLLLQ
ncbi:multidrug resistance-associated protein 1-like [Protopterus annectens]|uniref:multidrug resistance-associated protein 1-like n=1 Tax=Protopterus annectens TaxID=7888 RepID=UPI001CFC33B5|nr:multidrug resistance-associated protein 1-like [Protopterus annectens]